MVELLTLTVLASPMNMEDPRVFAPGRTELCKSCISSDVDSLKA